MNFTSPANIRDARIIQDYVVVIRGIQQVGTVPNFTPPDIEIETESFRGGGMDGTVEMPMGVKPIEFSFDMFTWNAQIWTELGFGPGSMNCPISFLGYTFTPNGAEGSVIIDTNCLLKSIKTGSVEPGKQVKMTASLACYTYTHTIDGEIVTQIDVWNKIFKINGVDKSAGARQLLGFTY